MGGLPEADRGRALREPSAEARAGAESPVRTHGEGLGRREEEHLAGGSGRGSEARRVRGLRRRAHQPQSALFHGGGRLRRHVRMQRGLHHGHQRRGEIRREAMDADRGCEARSRRIRRIGIADQGRGGGKGIQGRMHTPEHDRRGTRPRVRGFRYDNDKAVRRGILRCDRRGAQGGIGCTSPMWSGS